MAFPPEIFPQPTVAEATTPVSDAFAVEADGGELTPMPGFAPDEEPEFETIEFGETEEPAMDRISESDKKHKEVLEWILKRIKHSEQEMERFYGRWESNELRVQAYIHLEGKEAELKKQNDEGLIPNNTKMIVPFAYAALSTITTFLLHTFANRKPLFTVTGYKNEAKAAALNMETVLQYQADRSRMVAQLWKFFNDIGTYGVGILTVQWEVINRLRTSRKRRNTDSLAGAFGTDVAMQIEETVYEGNNAESVDPFMALPDPRVAMADCPTKGEYFFWRSSVSFMEVLRDPNYRDVDRIDKKVDPEKYPRSLRNKLAAGTNSGDNIHRMRSSDHAGLDHDFVWIDQGTVWIIPEELGLPGGSEPILYFFTIANKNRIIEARPFDTDHDCHPVAVAEPYGFGYGFGQPGPLDFVAPIQDMLSWLLNSHMDNVRTSLNNMFVVDPQRIVLSDLANPGPGKRIRLKKAAFGTDVRTALYQLPVQDITRSHIADADMMMNLGQMLLAINENVMGQPQEGGRKTASEVRISSQAAMSRLSMISRVISAQAISPMTEMMALNTLQFLSDEFYAELTGADGIERHIRAPDLEGTYVFPVHDGSLPLDRVAMFDLWTQLLGQGILQNEVLSAQYDIAGIFEHIADLGGAGDLDRFRRKPNQLPQQTQDVDILPDESVDDLAQRGNIIPISQAFG